MKIFLILIGPAILFCSGKEMVAMPPFELTLDLVTHLAGKSVVIHCNAANIMDRKFFTTAKKVNKHSKYFSLWDQSHCNISTRENVDIHLVPFYKDSVRHDKSCFEYRPKSDKGAYMFYLPHNNNNSEKKFENFPLNLDDDVLIINDLFNGQFQLTELYKVSPSERLQRNEYAFWSFKDGLNLANKGPKWYRRRNLMGHHFKVTSLVEVPFTSKMDFNESLGQVVATGSFPDLLNTLALLMNFSYTLIPPPDNAWGGLQPDGSWNGMMNLVQKGLVDFAPTSLIQTAERQVACDWTIPLVFTYQSVFIKNPTNAYNYTAYLEPITYMAWILVGIFLLATPLFLHATWQSSKEPQNASLGQAYSVAYIALVMMGSSHVPLKMSTRILFFSIIGTAAMIYWHWEAMLVSYLSNRKTVLPFRDLRDMYQSTDFRLALIPDTSFEDKFKYSKDSLFQSIYAERLEPHLSEYATYPNHLADMVHFIKDDFDTALYDSFIPISSSKEYRECEIVVTQGKYFMAPYAWAFPKHSPYLDMFNFFINELIEKGQWHALKQKHASFPQICPDMSGKPIDFANCFTAFLIFFTGAGLSVLVMAIELLIQYVKLQ